MKKLHSLIANLLSEKTFLKLNFILLTNFPVNSEIPKKFIPHKTTKKKKIFLKNFFFFLCLLNYFFKQKNNCASFFILSLKKKLLTLLRAPFRHKLSKKHLTNRTYKIILTITYKSSMDLKPIFDSNHLNFVITKFKWFESNICSQHKLKIKLITFCKKQEFNLIN